MSSSDAEPIVDDPDRVIVRDKRRLDPESGELRAPSAPAEPSDAAETPESIAAEEDKLAAELTADLQRVSAEYAN
ncbi:MAG: nucleotide exchange factor GrpE, partial [Frankiales bacterium]